MAVERKKSAEKNLKLDFYNFKMCEEIAEWFKAADCKSVGFIPS